MKEIRLKIAELFQIDAPSGDDAKDLAEVTAYVLKHYAFLPKPILVTIDGDEIVISFPEEPDSKKEEARRLADRAVKRASEGNYEKAVGIYKRVLELQPSLHSARRDLAMAYVEVGDVESVADFFVDAEMAKTRSRELLTYTLSTLSWCDNEHRINRVWRHHRQIREAK